MTGRLEDKSGVEYVADACDAYIPPNPPGDTDVRTVEHIKSALGRIKLSKITLMYFYALRHSWRCGQYISTK